jgi:hypothetical protein
MQSNTNFISAEKSLGNFATVVVLQGGNLKPSILPEMHFIDNICIFRTSKLILNILCLDYLKEVQLPIFSCFCKIFDRRQLVLSYMSVHSSVYNNFVLPEHVLVTFESVAFAKVYCPMKG